MTGRQRWHALFAGLCPLLFAGAGSVLLASDGPAWPADVAANAAAPEQSVGRGEAAAFGRLPVRFEPNVGQASAPVKFLAHGDGYSLALTEKGAILSLRKGDMRAHIRRGKDAFAATASAKHTLVRISLAGARPRPELAAERPQSSYSNYFIGNDQKQWHTRVANYGAVRYRQVYPGIDWLVYGNPEQLEYDLLVAPGADPRQINLEFDGAEDLALDHDGNLLVRVDGQVLRQCRPVVYQTDASGRRKYVEGHYSLERRQVAFVLGAYDRGRPLVIDPVLVYSTYLHGSGSAGDIGYAIAVDSSGSAYIAGFTDSPDFPTVDPFQSKQIAGETAFVSKFNAAGDGLVYSTYLTGNGGESARAIAVDGAGEVYVAGYTSSTTFPTVNAIQTINKASRPGHEGQTAFVTKFNAAGDALVYSTYLGGSGGAYVFPGTGDAANAIAVDRSGSAYVAGYTYSIDFPITSKAYQKANNEPQVGTAFVTKFSPDGSALEYSTYLGGSGGARFLGSSGTGIAADTVGNAYVTGYTGAPTFPTRNAFQSSIHTSYSNAFVTKLDAAGNALVYSTFLGGSVVDQAQAIAVDAAGEALIAGFSKSPDFPTLNPIQGINNCLDYGDAFVSKFNAAGNALVYSTYLGGSCGTEPYGPDKGDVAYGIGIDASGNVYVAGRAGSPDFPTVNPFQATNKSSAAGNAFFTKINSTGSALAYSTYLGGSGVFGDVAYAIAVDSTGNAYITGSTGSADFPLVGPYQATHNPYAINVFVTKLLAPPTAPLGLVATPGNARASLSWNSVAEASTYNVYQGTAAGAEVRVASGITGPSYVADGLVNGTTYYFEVSATNASGSSGYSNEASATPIGGPTEAPAFTPDSGTYIGELSVTIADATPGATIYYTIDGSVPTSSSAQYTGPIVLASSETINAIAIAAGYMPSPEASASYQINPPPPVAPDGLAAIAENAGANLSWNNVAGATTYNVYQGTAAGAEVEVASGITGPSYMADGLVNGTTYYFEVTATNAGGTSGYSNEASATPIAGVVATPTFSPAAGTYASKLSVVIADATPGSTIYFTTDGSMPTSRSSLYTAPIVVVSSETINAVAFSAGYAPSAEAGVSYQINPPQNGGGAMNPGLLGLLALLGAARAHRTRRKGPVALR